MPLTQLDERLGKVESDSGNLKVFIERVEASVEKLTEISADVTQLLAVHENRITTAERLHSQLEAKIEKRHDMLEEKLSKMIAKFDDIKSDYREDLATVKVDVLNQVEVNKKKISTLERWMWVCLGGGSALLFLADNLGKIAGAIH